jgi:dTDP-4-amino-4,6-dideoxygalactose transaminase
MINVTKSYLPPFEEYSAYLEELWESRWLTNRGKLVQQLEKEICNKLQLDHLLYVSNGTIAIQLAIKALELKGEIITTPFSYVATTTSILWENCKPVFCDIEPKTLCIDPGKIEQLITPTTSAILATHVFGIPCDVEKIESIAKKHNLKVIYDAAHAFCVSYKNRNIFAYGDISTCSFHATKVFHTVEGGSITCNDEALRQKLFLYHTFGHIGDDYFTFGVNAKNSEFHAAMGLCNLKVIDRLVSSRKLSSELYNASLNFKTITRPSLPPDTEYNYSYYPVIFENETILLKIKEELFRNGINTRRYFYPSLNQLPYLSSSESCKISEDISRRVLCLPLYADMEDGLVGKISTIINKCLEH